MALLTNTEKRNVYRRLKREFRDVMESSGDQTAPMIQLLIDQCDAALEGEKSVLNSYITGLGLTTAMKSVVIGLVALERGERDRGEA